MKKSPHEIVQRTRGRDTNLENLNLTGADNLSGTGNALNNVINGNDGANTLSGGAGNDTYIVDNIGDVVTENLAEGTDTVQSSIVYTLGDNVENLTLTGTTAIDGAGNALDNVITANDSGNTLSGLDGNDMLLGGAGSDLLDGGAGAWVEAANDDNYEDRRTA